MMRLHRDDNGTTLVEVLVTVMVVSIAFLALLGGLWTAVVASNSNVKLATAEATARAYAEFLKRQPYAVDDEGVPLCPATYNDAFPVPDGIDPPMITNIAYWDPVSESFGSDCEGANDLQLVSIQVQSTDLRAEEKLQVVKRR